MSTLITWEWGYLLTSMMWGMVLALAYDFIRIFRRLVFHKGIIWIFAEDIVFWMCCGFVIFHVTFLINDGIIRSFSLAGFAIGAAACQYATKGWFVENVSRAIEFILKPLKILIKYIRIGIDRCWGRFKSLYTKVKVKVDEKVRDKAGKTGKT